MLPIYELYLVVYSLNELFLAIGILLFSVNSFSNFKTGLLDNVLSDYLWAKAVLLTTTTVATAGLTIQVPLAAIVDSLTGHAPRLSGYLGALAVLIGFAGINIPSGQPKETSVQSKEADDENISSTPVDQLPLPPSQSTVDTS